MVLLRIAWVVIAGTLLIAAFTLVIGLVIAGVAVVVTDALVRGAGRSTRASCCLHPPDVCGIR